MHSAQFIRRREAGEYLRSQYGFGSAKTLAKLAVVGGGPEIFYAGPRTPLYTTEKLDAWARSKISPPVRSTSERKADDQAPVRPAPENSAEVGEK
ncbi:hypothetical protein M2322_003197 [Rhodoblastus acidophilus]|uniref:hypothetical protein n=1 Tax=Rhodoblastus acidophilus TaxID=1074 RepID=UPI0022249601|nr:hypothetical protein [Rhodoblastus acidophilus]MCW2317633.1 hypothetical protein [Rhodoblastus acidophilus]